MAPAAPPHRTTFARVIRTTVRAAGFTCDFCSRAFSTSSAMIHLYVEHLLNIRTLSIQAVLSTVSGRETDVTVSADGSILTISHEGEMASVKLPINISPSAQSRAVLTIPAVPSKNLTFRVQVEQMLPTFSGVLYLLEATLSRGWPAI